MHRSPSSLFKERKLESFTWDKESQKGSNENTSNISIAENSPLSHPLYTFKSGFGMLYIKDLGFTADSQMGFRPWHLPLYLALDFNYALFGYDSLLEILSGAYLESEKGTFQWAIGLLIGGAFPSNLTYFISNTYAFYLSSALSIHIDDNIKLMFEFRPGYVGPYSSFAANCMVAFYFL